MSDPTPPIVLPGARPRLYQNGGQPVAKGAVRTFPRPRGRPKKAQNAGETGGFDPSPLDSRSSVLAKPVPKPVEDQGEPEAPKRVYPAVSPARWGAIPERGRLMSLPRRRVELGVAVLAQGRSPWGCAEPCTTATTSIGWPISSRVAPRGSAPSTTCHEGEWGCRRGGYPVHNGGQIGNGCLFGTASVGGHNGCIQPVCTALRPRRSALRPYPRAAGRPRSDDRARGVVRHPLTPSGACGCPHVTPRGR